MEFQVPPEMVMTCKQSKDVIFQMLWASNKQGFLKCWYCHYEVQMRKEREQIDCTKSSLVILNNALLALMWSDS